ncbi:2-dehydropantoate 2-reductase [Mycetohabitans endofungorum]|uniref:2-dehydropantoate 2-reductase n=1 Tax=Mycetohabitans endofungorum TaxID=417203 RepID=UPI0030CFB006
MPRNITIVGAGAVGGLLASRLAQSGVPIKVLARGAQLEAIRSRGLTLIEDGESKIAHAHATDDPTLLGAQDIVFVCLKGHALVDAAASLAPLIGPHTRIVSVMNGVPWWFLHQFGGACADRRLESVDPGGVVSAALPVAQADGLVVHLAASVRKPGVIVRNKGNLLIARAPHDTSDAVQHEIVRLLQDARFDVSLASSIQHEIWAKLWGNMTMNPISVLTGSTADVILDDPLTARLVAEVMREAQAIGAKLGLDMGMSVEQRNAQTRQLGAFKTSMLQDAEAGRPMEIDGIVSAPYELARMSGVPTPYLDMLLGLIRLKGRSMGLYAGGQMLTLPHPDVA